ncbi:hypothetical protein [Enterococcus casseliflavus]|uniref:hypothetical protein n=1 Tax=Enterococcus casseliflavus TaxID=37734 RepID=UPI00289109D2|nr:hypothetical protein [Enterococcus casseliflavus]MDT2955600.1 hypothetical protein [Enterococcus casseliflavus]MDT2958804.1 hypothetical protein [Enterococcus casseliflavus]
MLKTIKPRALTMVFLGSTILSFGLFNIHSFSGVTEGGGLGLTLLLDHWFHLSPAITGFIFNMLCGWLENIRARVHILFHCRFCGFFC